MEAKLSAQLDTTRAVFPELLQHPIIVICPFSCPHDMNTCKTIIQLQFNAN